MSNYQKLILSKTLDYLKKKKWPHNKQGKLIMLKCPKCGQLNSAQVVDGSYKIQCLNCDKQYSLISIVRKNEKDKVKWDKEKILEYLKEELNIPVITPKDENLINSLFDFYVANNFSLVPLAKPGTKKFKDGYYSGKEANIEKNWQKKEHRNKSEWLGWLNSGLNCGINTAQSNILVIDFDCLTKQEEKDFIDAIKTKNKEKIKELETKIKIPSKIKKIIGNTLIQKTFKGYQVIYKADNEIRKGELEIEGIHVDVEADGGQVVCPPSKIFREGNKYQLYSKRKFINNNEIIKLPKELKDLLLSKLGKRPTKTPSEHIKEDMKLDTYTKPLIGEGEGRSNLFIRLYGKFRKFLPKHQVEQTLKVLDRVICKPNLGVELETTVFKSGENYIEFEEDDLINSILDYLREVDVSTKADLELVVAGQFTKGEAKKKLNTILARLLKEEKIIKVGTKQYQINDDLPWDDSLLQTGVPINFKMPYFENYAKFNFTDLLLIGAKTNFGKTILAINFIKRLVEQGIKPYYYYSETGGRHGKNALQLGLKDKDFFHRFISNPKKFKFPKKAIRPIIIYDWIKPPSYADTDELFGELVEKLQKSGGLLIGFVQLRDNNAWFAKDLIEQFPSFACKYLYEDDDGVYTKFVVTKTRESKVGRKNFEIPTVYEWDTKLVKLREDVENEKVKSFNLGKENRKEVEL